MSVNKNLPHVLVLPEDDANRQIANGFYIALDWTVRRQMQVEPVAGGWRKVLDSYVADRVAGMDRYPERFLVLLIDFDDHYAQRLPEAKGRVPERLAQRVFVLGAWSKPEALKQALGGYESIGEAMAKDCREGTNDTWGHELLRHNQTELERLRIAVRPFLFPR